MGGTARSIKPTLTNKQLGLAMSVFTAEAPATTASILPEETPKRLTLEQAQALFQLIEAFRPGWADRRTVMGKLQDTALYTDLEGHEVASLVITAAATEPDRNFGDLPFLGVNPHLGAIDEEDED